MKQHKIDKIVCEVYRSNTTKLINFLKMIGIFSVHIQSGRSIVLREKQDKVLLSKKTTLEEDPTDLFYFYVYSENTDWILSRISQEMNIITPGNGSIFCEEIDLVNKSSINYINEEIVKTNQIDNAEIFHDLMGIRCIVQRGQGNEIVRSALDMGTTVPTATFGEGTGLRDKLGLLRITIPAEKEIVNLIINRNDAGDIMNVLIDAGRLDFPGKGFIYIYPIEKGLINSKILRGKQKHAASMEQIILAIDSIRGNMDWRKRSAGGDSDDHKKKRKFLNNLVDLTFICNEGRSMELVNEAMAVGASGGTISKLRFNDLENRENSPVSRAREMANMIIGEKQVAAITECLNKSGLFNEATCGILEIKPAPKACTYLG